LLRLSQGSNVVVAANSQGTIKVRCLSLKLLFIYPLWRLIQGGEEFKLFNFHNIFLWFENNCFDKRKVFWPYTPLREQGGGDMTKGSTTGPKGWPLGKKFPTFHYMFLWVENNCFDKWKGFLTIGNNFRLS
jgi:hypothetical protein